jgi:hypothetical protein
VEREKQHVRLRQGFQCALHRGVHADERLRVGRRGLDHAARQQLLLVRRRQHTRHRVDRDDLVSLFAKCFRNSNARRERDVALRRRPSHQHRDAQTHLAIK